MNHTWNVVRIVFIGFAVAVLAARCAQGTEQVAPSPVPTDRPVEQSATPSPAATPRPAPANVAIAVSPTSGPPGSKIQVTVAGFSPETEIELAMGPEDSEYDISATVRTDADGTSSTALAVPTWAEPEEAWVVVAATRDGAYKGVSNVFKVTAPEYEPAVSISPTSGPPGTEVHLVAKGFPPAAPVEIGIGRERSEYDVVNTLETGSDGSLTTDVALPGHAEAEERWVVVVTTIDRSVETISNVFQVTEPAYQGTVAISPRSGPPGTRVNVVAEGFPPNAPVEIGVGRVNSEYDVLATAQTDPTGRVESQVTIPGFVDPDERWVIVVAAQDRSVKAVSDEFDVTRTPTPSGSLFTRTNIYLIAIGEDSQSVKEIGCGDSVVPVEVAIEPTIAPLTAALNKLLSIKSREYGLSGYYNALYRSDLALEDVAIIDREAVIRLSGTLTLGGVCDEPRVRAQLQETALQYATVDTASVFINGVLLGEE